MPKNKKKVYLHFPDLTYKILFLAQNYSPLISNNGHPQQGATRSSQRPIESLDEGLMGGSSCAALTTKGCLTRCHHRWPGRTISLRKPAGHVINFLFVPPSPSPPLPPPRDAQMTGCALVRFLWCMLWWRISSSERANFFWQLDQRQVKGFSPDEKGINKEENRKSLL